MGDKTHLETGFGAMLRGLRTRAQLSQSQLAARANMNSAGVAKLEQGVREPSWATVLRLAAALRVRVDAFVPDDVWGPATDPPRKSGANS